MEQRGHVSFRIQVIPLPPTGVIDGPLHINHDERGIWWQGTGQAANHTVIIKRFQPSRRCPNRDFPRHVGGVYTE
jgi:hypothetical protein